jgi:hypothetical protein
VISGFNTDVECGGITYHIQTEDKGLDTPVILSLVYDRGTILAAKRVPYDDLLEKGFDEKVLNERLTKQHKTICAAIKKGRINDLKSFTLQKRNGNGAVFSPSAGVEVLEVLPSFENGAPAGSPGPLTLGADAVSFPSADFDAFDELAPPIPMPKAPVAIPKQPVSVTEPVIEAVTVVDIPDPLPFDAVMVVSDLAGTERPESHKLSLQFIGEDTFLGGQKAYITVMVCRGGAQVVEGAEVMVKVIGSSFRPLIFHSQTDKNGISTVGMQIPSFNSGRASILVRAINKGEEVELRRPIIHG